MVRDGYSGRPVSHLPQPKVVRVKKVDGQELTARERKFALLVADPRDGRSIGAKGQDAGWREARYGYRVARRPHVAAEIERVHAENMRTMRARVARVMGALADKAEDGDVQAAKVFLEAAGVIGSGGVTIVNSQSTQAASGFPELLARHWEERREMLRKVGMLPWGPSIAREPGEPAIESTRDGNGGDPNAPAEDTQSAVTDANEGV